MEPEQAKKPDEQPGSDSPQREYQKSYYAKNRERLSNQKAARYRVDPLYRELIKAKALAGFRRRREQEKIEAALHPPAPRKKRGPNQPRVVILGGKIVTVHGVKELVDRIDRDEQTITGWERGNVIPPPTYRDPDHRRWFSSQYIEALAEAVRRYDAEGASRQKRLKEIVKECFERVEAYDEQVPFE